MEIEHVARVGFTSRRTTQQQGNLAIGHGLLGQIVIDDQRVFTAIAEVLAHGAAGVGCQELQRCGFGSRGRDDDGVGQSAVLFQLAYHVGDGRLLLTDGHVDAFDAAVTLVDDGVDRHGGLADLAVTDDQLALATTDRDHGVDRLVAGLHRLVDRLTPDHARCHFLDRVGRLSVDRALAIDRVAQRVDHATQQLRTYRNFEDAAGALGAHAFGQAQVVTQNHGTDGVLLQVQCHAEDAARELDHFAVHDVGQTVDAYDAVRHADDGALVTGLSGDIGFLDALLDDFTNLGRIQLLHAMTLKSGFQRFGQLAQFAADRTVDNHVTGANDHAADQRRVHDLLEVDGAI